jgi:hypothetical protein
MIGSVVGPIGYGCTSLLLSSANPGRRQPLSLRTRRILAHCYTPWFREVDLDAIVVRLEAAFPGIPARPDGMALGDTIYLKQATFDECNIEDMLLLLHELVHVAQYRRDTRVGFARVYGTSVVFHLSNRCNPLEQEAEDFTREHAPDLVQAITNICAGES